MAKSFFNKILRVNLTTGTITVDEHDDLYYREYMGGWNIIADVLLREVPTGTDPLGPDNKLIFAPGVLAGLPVSGASRAAVGAKSPLTGAFGAGEFGGNFPAQFKRTGFDALIVEGQSDKPVYLWITDGTVEIRDASHLWGKLTKETQEQLRADHGKRVEAALIGPGGENLSRIACVMSGLKDAAGRTGMGAVMGSKNLKAVAVLGTINIEASDPDAVRELSRTVAGDINEGIRGGSLHKWGTGVGLDGGAASGNLPIRNFRDGEFPGAKGLGAEVYMETIGKGMEACFGCALRCKKVVETETPYKIDPEYGGPEYESVGALGSTCGVEDIVAVSKATELCNAYGLDTIGTGVTIAFAMEAFENEMFNLEQTQGIDLSFGNGDAVVKMVEKIALREGLGDLLAEGSYRAAQTLGEDAMAFPVVAKGQEYPMHEPRLKRGLAIGYAVSPTGADHCHSLHDTGLVNATEEGFNFNGMLRGMGAAAPIPLENLGPEKARAQAYHSMNMVSLNCQCMCLFVPWNNVERVKLMQAATGWDVTMYELLKVGERALTLARIFNLREGFTSADDKLAPRSYTPTTNGALADGALDAEKVDEGVHYFYGVMGWDMDGGVPLPGKLYELGIGWAGAYLE